MGEQDPGIGIRLRAARARLGWSREALAFHSGVSWAGIAQVESGRRRDVRSGTLIALARALGVTTDYLVLGGADAGAGMCEHRLLRYRNEQELVSGVAPFLSDAVEQSGAALAVTKERNISLLRQAVGGAADSVQFVECSDWPSSPLAALNAYEEYCMTTLSDGVAWVRIVAELTWAGRSPAAARPWVRLESMLNLSLATLPVSILCVCDARSLRPPIERLLSVTHPGQTAPRGGAWASSGTDPRAFLLER
jgi:transcriptional regulator with XRE-family HTH domain